MNTNNIQKETETPLLECERRWIFALMISVAGFFGAYTFSCRGGIFCNAQTANFVLFGMSLGTADWKKALYYLIPMASYLGGTIISEAIPKSVKKFIHIRWDTVFVAFEMLMVLLIGFIPESAPVQICQIMINFICAMQYNTFRSAENIPASTTFCSAHTRAAGVYFVKWIKHKNHSENRKKCLFHVKMISAFIAGTIISGFLCKYFGIKAIWFSELLLIPVFADLLHADLTKEKNLLDIVPRGH